jgi:hypothetical protein
MENNFGASMPNLVNSFCVNEFNDNYRDADRDVLIRYSLKMENELRFSFKMKPDYIYEWYIESDPIFIVDSYKIQEIKQLDNTHGYAFVNYHQLARSVGWGNDPGNNITRKLVKDVRDIQVKLNLEYDGKRWWIIDPPYPKVSYDVIKSYYQAKCSDIEQYFAPSAKPLSNDAREALEKSYQYHKGILDFFMHLKDDNREKTS